MPETPQPHGSEIIELPADIQEAAEASRAARKNAFEADVAERAVQAALSAAEVNASRPEGVPSTLPSEGITPVHQELTSATVRSPRL